MRSGRDDIVWFQLEIQHERTDAVIREMKQISPWLAFRAIGKKVHFICSVFFFQTEVGRSLLGNQMKIAMRKHRRELQQFGQMTAGT